MKRARQHATALFAALWTISGAAVAAEPSLLPKPAVDRPATGAITISEKTAVLAAQTDSAALAASGYFLDLLRRSGALPLHGGSSARPIIFTTDAAIGAGHPDAYRLTIAPTGIIVAAASDSGLFYGGITLWQLLTQHDGNGPVTLPAQTIEDAPRFAWRGLMLDSARHFQSVAYIKDFIDWMALHKFNVFHWHLTDDEGWRIEIKQYPKLTDIGAWRVPAGYADHDIDPATGKPRLEGGFYTQEQIRDIVAFAQARHITIIPEIDMPGHATAAIAAYPDLGVPPVAIAAPSSDWGLFPNILNVDDSTFAFMDTVLSEVMDLFPGSYIHVGGDEAVKDQWKASEAIQARMKTLNIADEDALQSYFIGRIETFLNQHGRRLVGWDEILQGGIAPNATVMSWRGIDGAVAAVKAGHDAVLAPSPILYFDHRQGTSPDEPPGRGLVVSTEEVYRFNPMPDGLSTDEAAHILGLQANIFTEHIRTEERVTRMAWPRAAALAEVAWSPAALRHWDDFASRLKTQQQRYRRIGLKDDELPPRTDHHRLYSQDLKLCSDKVALSLEDDAPLTGPRAVFLVDIENPCWILPQAKLDHDSRLTVSVGQIPFNFQIGKDRDAIHLRPPHTPAGELEVRADGCDGELIAALPLGRAVDNPGVTTLSSPLGALRGRHDLCFSFTGKTIDPLWVLNWIDLTRTSERP